MKQRLFTLLVACSALVASSLAMADLTGARATPRQAGLTGTGTNVVPVSWRVATTPDHATGAFSGGGIVVDATTGNELLTVRDTFSGDGPGPYTFREVLRLDAETVRLWLERGLSRVVFLRTFSDPAGNSVEASVVLRLNRSGLTATRDAAPGTLVVTSLRMEFESGNNTALTGVDTDLRSLLTVTYTGSGVLRGRWQIAEPESADGIPLFRTLGLVNRNLTGRQRVAISSPPLPTRRPGKYLLRFCVTPPVEPVSAAADPQCPEADLVATATYQVRGDTGTAVSRILDLDPDRQAVDAATAFSWRPLDGARVYQLQIFSLAPADAGIPGSRNNPSSVEPSFVTGMLLDEGTRETTLSDLVLSRLEPGRRYLWRITAHDYAGRLIGRSSDADFVYRPAN